MAYLDDYIIKVKALERSDFVREHQHSFLLVSDSRDEDVSWSFKTQTVSTSKLNLARLSAQGLSASLELAKYRVFPITKGQANPWRERISIGRARNNDIVLQDNSVSKLHAHIAITEERELHLTDAGSRNGTKVNGERIASSDPVILKGDDRIAVGRLNLVVLDAADLYDFLDERVELQDDDGE